MQHSTDKIVDITVIVKLVVEHWLEREIARRDRSNDPSHHQRMLYHGATARSRQFKVLHAITDKKSALPRSYGSLPPVQSVACDH